MIKEEAVMEQHNPTCWPGDDERLVVNEMIYDGSSKHWEECSHFVQRRVYLKAKNIPRPFKDEITQEIMLKVIRHLPAFHFHCTLRTWLNLIIQNCIVDAYRRMRMEERFHFSLADQLEEGDDEEESFSLHEEKSAEDACMVIYDLRKALIALKEYTHTRPNSDRNWLILQMVLLEGVNHKEAAETTGCSAPVVGYVVREAQRYVREKLD